nr:hypothetical protein [Mucilaginibacter sp. L294]
MRLHFFKNAILATLLLMFSLSAYAQQKGDPPSVKAGMQIKRSYLIKQIQSSDSTMAFKQGADIDSEPYFVGIDKDQSSVEFFGKDDELKKAVFTCKFTTDKDINKLQYQRMAYFAYLMGGPNSVKWLEECAAKFVTDNTKPFYNAKYFDFNRKGFYKYEPANKAIILTFTDI